MGEPSEGTTGQKMVAEGTFLGGKSRGVHIVGFTLATDSCVGGGGLVPIQIHNKGCVTLWPCHLTLN